MADAFIKQKIYNGLKKAYFPDNEDFVDISDGEEDSIHIVIVTRSFTDRRLKEKNEMIWEVLDKELLPEESEKVTLAVWKTPEQVKAA